MPATHFLTIGDPLEHSEHFREHVALCVALRALCYLGKGESEEAVRMCDRLDWLLIHMSDLERSVVHGLLTDLLQFAEWKAPKPPSGRKKLPTAADWEKDVREAAEQGPETLLDALRRSPPHPSLQKRRQEFRAAAWTRLGSPAAAAAFMARA